MNEAATVRLGDLHVAWCTKPGLNLVRCVLTLLLIQFLNVLQ